MHFFPFIEFILIALTIGFLHSSFAIGKSGENPQQQQQQQIAVPTAKQIAAFIANVQYNVETGVQILKEKDNNNNNKNGNDWLMGIEEQIQAFKKQQKQMQTTAALDKLNGIASLVTQKAKQLARHFVPFHDEHQFEHAYTYERLFFAEELEKHFQQKSTGGQECPLSSSWSNSVVQTPPLVQAILGLEKQQLEMITAFAMLEQQCQQQWQRYFAYLPDWQEDPSAPKTPDELQLALKIAQMKKGKSGHFSGAERAQKSFPKLFRAFLFSIPTVFGPFAIAGLLAPFQCARIGYHKLGANIAGRQIENLQEQKKYVENVVYAGGKNAKE